MSLPTRAELVAGAIGAILALLFVWAMWHAPPP
jgi:hypothetical protein